MFVPLLRRGAIGSCQRTTAALALLLVAAIGNVQDVRAAGEQDQNHSGSDTAVLHAGAGVDVASGASNSSQIGGIDMSCSAYDHCTEYLADRCRQRGSQMEHNCTWLADSNECDGDGVRVQSAKLRPMHDGPVLGATDVFEPNQYLERHQLLVGDVCRAVPGCAFISPKDMWGYHSFDVCIRDYPKGSNERWLALTYAIVERCKATKCSGEMDILDKWGCLEDDNWRPSCIKRARLETWPDALSFAEIGQVEQITFHGGMFLLPLRDDVWPKSLRKLVFFDDHDRQDAAFISHEAAFPPNLEDLEITKSDSLVEIATKLMLPDSLQTVKIWRCSQLSIVPDVWPGSLTNLNLRENGLTEITGETIFPDSLRALELRGNRITKISKDVVWSRGLVHLGLSSNLLVAVPHLPPSRLPRLRNCVMVNNSVSSMPAVWPDSLMQINLQGNDLQFVNKSAWPSNLTVLDLSGNSINAVHEETVLPNGLLYLDLAYNNLRILPKGMVLPERLRWLSFSGNNLVSFPDSMTSWPHELLELFLNANDLGKLPDTTWPRNLTKLDLQFNRIAALPEVAWPRALKELKLAGNNIRKLPNKPIPQSVQFLSITNNALLSLPSFPVPPGRSGSETGRLRLDLSNNGISARNSTLINVGLSSNVTEELDLSNNAMTTLANIAWPEQLEHLNLSGNALRSVPSATELPKKIKELILDYNTWETMLQDIARMQAKGEIGTVKVGAPVPFLSDLVIETDQVCQGTDTVVLSAVSKWWNCSQVDKACLDSYAACPNKCTLKCHFTEEGAKVIAGQPAAIAASIEEVGERSQSVIRAGVSACFVASLMVPMAVRPWDKMRLATLFVEFWLSSIDVLTDWAFYYFEIISSDFEERYTCDPNAPEFQPEYLCSVDGDDAPFSCTDYGPVLHGNCGRLQGTYFDFEWTTSTFWELEPTTTTKTYRVDNEGMTNECACKLYSCVEGTCGSFGKTSRPELEVFKTQELGGQELGGIKKNSYDDCGVTEPEPDCLMLSNKDRSFSCDSYAGLDSKTNETCGYLSPNVGANECECHTGGRCVPTKGSGGICLGSTNNDFSAFKLACLVANFLASVTWIISFILLVSEGRQKRKFSLKVYMEAKPAVPRSADSESTEDGVSSRLRHALTAAKLSTVCLEDVPQLYFLLTYNKYMGIFDDDADVSASTRNLVILSLILTCCSIGYSTVYILKRLLCYKKSWLRPLKSLWQLLACSCCNQSEEKQKRLKRAAAAADICNQNGYLESQFYKYFDALSSDSSSGSDGIQLENIIFRLFQSEINGTDGKSDASEGEEDENATIKFPMLSKEDMDDYVEKCESAKKSYTDRALAWESFLADTKKLAESAGYFRRTTGFILKPFLYSLAKDAYAKMEFEGTEIAKDADAKIGSEESESVFWQVSTNERRDV